MIEHLADNKWSINWTNFDDMIRVLTANINHKDFKNIYAIPRGGLVVGVALSHHLGLPLILDKRRITSKTLIVDDIVDTGRTMVKLLKRTRGNNVACLFWNQEARFKPRWYVAHKKHSWVVFPWETLKSSKYDKTADIL